MVLIRLAQCRVATNLQFFFFKRVILEAKESKVCLESQKTSNCQPSWGKVEGAAVQGRVSAGLRTWPPQLLIGLLLCVSPTPRPCLWLLIPNLASVFGHLPSGLP